MKYIIINTTDIHKVDFSKCLQTSWNSLRCSCDGEKAVLKYADEQPAFVYDITNDSIGLPEYDHNEIIKIVNSPEWKSQN